jgi:hypothetical protein
MTAPRQPGKSQPVSLWRALTAILLLLCGLLPPDGRASAATPVVEVNSYSGLAISGFDPVAYFGDKSPKAGRQDLELSFDGAVWRFRNEGNRAAFAEHPDVYMPRFSGYDPVAIARGASVPGHPLFWAVVAERLYLFYSEEARKEFLADPGHILDRAARKWPQVARTIAR